MTSGAPAPGYRHLVERALTFIEAAGAPQATAAIAAHVLGESVARQPALLRLFEDSLVADGRLHRQDGERWGLRTWSTGDLSLGEQEFVAIDVETTGGQTERHRIVEVAAVRLRNGAMAEQFAALVQPPRPLPKFVTEFTGITPEMLETAALAGSVIEDFRRFVGDAVLVGHNVMCDLSFLNYEALWNGLPPFGNPALDTEELAARLMPDLRRPSLNRVAAALGLTVPARHRALPDARLTAGVLLHLLNRLDGQGIETFAQLQAWLSSRLAQRQERVRRVRAVLPAGVLRSLPDAPGVYTFHDADGRVLYVGKAASLRNRVAQHFTGVALAIRQYDALLERTAAVEHATVSCELEALLLESEKIRVLQPLYNVQTHSRRGAPFVRFETEPFPRITAVRHVEGDPSLHVGPFRTTQAARRTIETVRRVFQLRSCRRTLPAQRAAMRLPCVRLGQQRCPAPCADRVTPAQYEVLVEYARRYVREGKDATLGALDFRLAALALGGHSGGWEHIILREARKRLARVRQEYRPLDGGLSGGALVVAYPATGGGIALFFVRDGHLAGRLTVPSERAQVDYLATLVRRHLFDSPTHRSGPDGRGKGAEDADDTDETNILMRWIHQHAGDTGLVPLDPACSPEDVARAILEVVPAASAVMLEDSAGD